MSIRQMLDKHAQPTGVDLDARVRCIEACSDCAAVCTSCADANLSESDLQAMVRCVRRCLDCADVCDATARIVTRQTASDVGVVRAGGRSLRGGVPRLARGVRASRRAPRALPHLRPGVRPLRAGM